MESKPIITCHGDQTLFSSLHAAVVQGLPREPIEWRRSYGRPPRKIFVEANFVPFSVEILPKDTDYSLVTKPFFYMYWTDCDMDTYKQTVREDIQTWLNRLKACHVTDWLIVVVVQDESKVKTKLLSRSSVVDKVKNDFCSKQSDRCIALTEPFKADTKSAESWGMLLARMRALLLQSYNRSLLRFEEFMRSQRERRTEHGWNFCNYFMLQEELAFMFEILGLHDEALVQYDELDALFTQFVLNHAAGANVNETGNASPKSSNAAEWLSSFMDTSLQTWDGLSLVRPISWEARELIRKNRSSLLEFRNYLFSRQCALLILMHRPWEIAQRSIPFMHNCIHELKMLEIKMPPGAVACWVFLSCLEIVQTCTRFKDSVYVEAYSLYTASLWEYARKKLLELGMLCGLMPNMDPSSQQLNMVVDLIAGLGHTSIGRNQVTRDAMEKLQEALSSKALFQKHYLELAELAMGTFKQIGRLRSARMIGKDLATFYLHLGETRKAEGFLTDALNMFKKESWDMLSDHTRLEIAACQRILQDFPNFARSCMYIACSKVLDDDVRLKYQQEWHQVALKEHEETLLVRAHPIIIINQLQTPEDKSIVNEPITVTLNVTCNLLKPITCQAISLSLIPYGAELNSSTQSEDEFRRRRRRNASSGSMELTGLMTHSLSHPTHLDIKPHYQVQSDQAVAASSLVCKSVLRRSDSETMQQLQREREIFKDDVSCSLSASDITLQPGENVINLSGVIDEKGTYCAHQISVLYHNLEMMKSLPQHGTTFEVFCDEPMMTLSACTDVNWAGFVQYLHLHVSSGSRGFDSASELSLTASDGLRVWFEDTKNQEGMIQIDKMLPDTTVSFTVVAMATLPINKENIEHQIQVHCDWFPSVYLEEFVFKHPFQVTNKLHTAGKRKFVQVMLHGRCLEEFSLSNQKLTTSSPDITFISLNPANKNLMLSTDVSASCLWELKNNISADPVLSCSFSVEYSHLTSNETASSSEICSAQFEISDYKTLYIMKPEVVPTIDKEKCKAGEVCYLQVNVSSTDDHTEKHTDSQSQLFLYEVVPDDKYWAVSGKTKGIFELEGGCWDISVQLLPLTGGNLPLPTITLFQYIPTDLSPNLENSETILQKQKQKDDPESKPRDSTSSHDTINQKDNQSETKTVESEQPLTQSDSKNKTPQNTVQEEIAVLMKFKPGQVYNSSLGSQIHVLPAQNISHVDVVVL